MSRLIAVEESGDQLTDDEIVSTCVLLLVAGHETTVNLIGNAILAMLRQPSQWTALGDDADRAPAVIEETLRYDPPVQTGRPNCRRRHDDWGHRGGQGRLDDAADWPPPSATPPNIDRPDVFDPDRKTLRH